MDPSKKVKEVISVVAKHTKNALSIALEKGQVVAKIAMENGKILMGKADSALAAYMAERERLGAINEEQNIRQTANNNVRNALRKAEMMAEALRREEDLKRWITPDYLDQEQLTQIELKTALATLVGRRNGY